MAWLVKRKQIQNHLGGVSWRTVLRWKKMGLPIFNRLGGRSTALSEELDLWLIKFDAKKKADKRFKKPLFPKKRDL